MIHSLFLAYHIYGLIIRIASFVSCIKYILFCVVVCVVIAGRWRTIYFSYFVPRFLFSLSTFLDFIYLPKSNSFLWGLDTILYWGYTLGFGLTLKVFFFCSLEEILVLLEWDLFFRICCIFQKNKYRIRANWGCQKMAWTKVNMKYSSLFRLCQILLIIYLRFL